MEQKSFFLQKSWYSNVYCLYTDCSCLVAKSFPTPCNPMDCSLPGCPSMEFPRHVSWSGLSFPSPGDLPDPGIESGSPALTGRFFTTEPQGKADCFSRDVNNPVSISDNSNQACQLQNQVELRWLAHGESVSLCLPHHRSPPSLIWAAPKTIPQWHKCRLRCFIGPRESYLSHSQYCNVKFCCRSVTKSCPTPRNPRGLQPARLPCLSPSECII